MKKIKVSKESRERLLELSKIADIVVQGVSFYFVGEGFCKAIFKKPCKSLNWFIAGSFAEWAYANERFGLNEFFDNFINCVFEVVDEETE